MKAGVAVLKANPFCVAEAPTGVLQNTFLLPEMQLYGKRRSSAVAQPEDILFRFLWDSYSAEKNENGGLTMMDNEFSTKYSTGMGEEAF